MNENPEYSIKYNIKGYSKRHKISSVKKFISKLFNYENNVKYVNINIVDELLTFKVFDEHGNIVKNKWYPYNIKHKDILGFYHHETRLMILPVSNSGLYRIKIGVGTNRPIREIFSIIR